MKTIYLLDTNLCICAIIIVSILLLICIVALVDMIHRKNSDCEWSNWSVTLPRLTISLILIALIVVILIIDIRLVKCILQWEMGEYQIIEGNIKQLVVEDDTLRGDEQAYYRCSFWINEVFFPQKTNRYTGEQVQMMSDSSWVIIYYLYDGGSPWPWRIDVCSP